jgi:hypothetical protein
MRETARCTFEALTNFVRTATIFPGLDGQILLGFGN